MVNKMLNKTHEEVELKRQEIERYLLEMMSKELIKWQQETCLCISDVNIRLAPVKAIRGIKHNIVTSVNVDLSYSN